MLFLLYPFHFCTVNVKAKDQSCKAFWLNNSGLFVGACATAPHLLNPGEVHDGPPRRTHSIGDLIQRKNGGIVAEFGFLNRSGSHRQTGLPQRESMRSSIPYTFQPTSPQCFFADCFRIAQRNPAARTMASTGSTDLLPQVILASAHPAASNISRALLLSSIW